MTARKGSKPSVSAATVAFERANAAHLTNALRGVASWFSDATGEAWTVKCLGKSSAPVGWALVSSSGARTDFRIEASTLVAVSVAPQKPQPVVARVPLEPTMASITRAFEALLFPSR